MVEEDLISIWFDSHKLRENISKVTRKSKKQKLKAKYARPIKILSKVLIQKEATRKSEVSYVEAVECTKKITWMS